MTEFVEEPLPIKISEALSLADIYEGNVSMESIVFLAEDIIIVLGINIGDGSPEQSWELRILNVQVERIVRTWSRAIGIYTDHYLLWQFTDDNAELCINGTDASPESLVADFYSLHQAAFGEWLPVEAYVSDLLGKAKCKQAQFAKGPRKILECYAKVLSNHSRNPYFLDFDGLVNANARAVKIPLKLLIFGESYFIGQDFVFTKLNT